MIFTGKSPNQQVLHGAIQVAGDKSVIFSFEIRRRLLRIYMNASVKDRQKEEYSSSCLTESIKFTLSVPPLPFC